MKEFKVKFIKNGKEIDTLVIDADNIEVKFVKNGKEVEAFVIDTDNIEEAKITAETPAHEDGAWWDDIEFKVSEKAKMKEFEVKFVKKGKELDTFIIDADNIEEAKTTAEDLAHADGVWSYDLEIKVSEEF